MTQSGIKLFNFQGAPVTLKWWFLILLAFLSFQSVVIIFASVLLHELGHAYVANKLGYKVNGVNIDIFFGSAEIDLSQVHERDSIKITLGGPIMNLILCLITFPFSYLGYGDLFADIFNINGILFISNMLPIYPLDGGRIFRDIMIIKNRRIAIKVSAMVSLSFSLMSAGVGIIFGYWMASIFALLFAYFALKDLKIIK